MKNFFLLLLIPFATFAQEDELIKQVKAAYETTSMQCSVQVHVDVPGLKMPDKKIFIRFEQNKAPIIKGDGMMLVPKKGLIGQFNEIFAAKSQILFLGNKSDTALYKVVSLDPESDWVTADLKIYRPDKRIYFMDVFTKEYGSFKVRHTYGNLMLPQKSIVTFEAEAFKLPLKFMGRGTDDIPTDENGKVKGTVALTYSEIQLL
jgi:hypothetical protein